MSDPVSPSPSAAPRPRFVRWWPAVTLITLGFVAILIIQQLPHRSQQHANIQTAQALAATLIGLLLWLLFASRLPWKRRFATLGIILLAGLLMAGMFRIRGVTGNLIPILEPRWSSHVTQAPAPTTSTNAPAALPGAADFPQFLGPSRNGVLSGPRLSTNWNDHPPALLWRQPVGAAWSGFAIVGARAVTQEQRGEQELTVCYDLATGAVLWSRGTTARYFTPIAGEGPRATPTIADGRVFSQGATGMLLCIDLLSGRELWSRDVIRTNGGEVPAWGDSSSPLAMGDRVVVNAGGKKDHALVAYYSSDGSPAWNGGNEGDSYSSPLIVTLDGVRQIVLFSGSLVGHDADTGRELWRFHWPGGHPHIAMPVVANATDLILSSGYGTGSGRVRIARDPGGKWAATPVWKGNRLKAKFTNPVLYRGHVYGLDDGILACLNAETGELVWKDGRYGHGQTLLVGERLLLMGESGEVILVDPQPAGLHELARFQALSGKTWNPPALAGEYLVVRNDKEAACYRLAVE